QTSLLKPYVPTMILEKIIIDLEDEVVSLLAKEKENLETIESLKSKGFESSEKEISKSENQSENDCQVVENVCDDLENPNVFSPGMLKLMSLLVILLGMHFCNSYDVDVNDLFVLMMMFKAYDGNRAFLTNFVEKFLGTVHFGNKDFAVIAGYGDVVIRSMMIKRVYYVEGL
nr:hypothetical protein [Tanacetum cinerariifolium]